MGFDLEVNRRAGVKHQTAHAVSRFRAHEADDKDFEDEIPVLPIVQASRK